MYHTLIYQRRGMKVNALVDDDAPVVAEIMGTERKMDYSEMHVGGKAFKILQGVPLYNHLLVSRIRLHFTYILFK